MKILAVMIFFVSTLQIYCQDLFVNYLDKQDLETEIDYQVIVKYFQIDTLWKRSIGTRFSLDSKILDKDNNINIVILNESNGVGGIAYLYSFTNNGNIIDEHKIMEGFDNGDLSGPDYDYFYSLKDQQIIISHRLEIPILPTSDEPRRTHITENYYTYIQIYKHGYFYELTQKDPPSDKRLFEYASNGIVPIELLKRLTQDDLAIMRNEIFASHGYIFKRERMSLYFKEMNWYEPRFDNVDDRLIPVEQENLELIKRFEQ